MRANPILAWLCAGTALALGLCAQADLAGAQRYGGGRSYARSSVYRAAPRNVDVNRNVNVNVNRNVNVHENVAVYNPGYYYGPWGHPVAAAAVTATAIAVGTIVATLPPHCSAVVVGNVTYQNCGGTYYQPMYRGTTVQYVVVNAP